MTARDWSGLSGRLRRAHAMSVSDTTDPTRHTLYSEAADELDAARDAHRDLVKRLGFGDDITEPMADNDTIVLWFEERGSEADEWRESERWRDECHEAGHPDDEDCWECDPRLRLQKAEEALARVGALADDLSAEVAELREEVPPVGPSRVAHVYRTAGLSDAHDRLRAALAEVDR